MKLMEAGRRDRFFAKVPAAACACVWAKSTGRLNFFGICKSSCNFKSWHVQCLKSTDGCNCSFSSSAVFLLKNLSQGTPCTDGNPTIHILTYLYPSPSQQITNHPLGRRRRGKQMVRQGRERGKCMPRMLFPFPSHMSRETC